MTFVGPTLVCPNCKHHMNMLILLSTWLDKTAPAEGCEVVGIGEDIITVRTFRRGITAIKYDATEVTMTFAEFTDRYEPEYPNATS